MKTPVFNSLQYSKRIELLLNHDRFYIGESVLKTPYCDPYYIDEFREEAIELLEDTNAHQIKEYVTKHDISILDFPTFIEFAKEVLTQLTAKRLNLHKDTFIKEFKVMHEKDSCN